MWTLGSGCGVKDSEVLGEMLHSSGKTRHLLVVEVSTNEVCSLPEGASPKSDEMRTRQEQSAGPEAISPY